MSKPSVQLGLLRRFVAAIRVEELLTGVGLGLFWVLERLRVSHFELWTQFFREGLLFYLGLALLVVCVEGLRFVIERRSAGQVEGRRPLPLQTLLHVGRVSLRFLRDWAPFVLLLTVYENLIWLVARVNPRLFDAAIQRLDDLLLFGRTTFWLERFVSAGRTEWFSFFYNVLFVYPVLVGGILYLLRRRKAYRRWLLTFSLAGYLGFLGYLLVPVVGPAYYYEGLYTRDLSGRLIHPESVLLEPGEPDALAEQSSDGEPLRFHELALRLNRSQGQGQHIPRNCFPSLHTAWGVVILVFLFFELRPLFWVALFPVLNLIFATVYLRFHYFTDLAAGLMLASLTLGLVPLLLRVEARARRALRGETPGSWDEQPPRSLLERAPTSRKRLALHFVLPALFFAAVGGYLALGAGEVGEAQLLEAQREVLQAHRVEQLPGSLATRLGARFGRGIVLEGLSHAPLGDGSDLRVDLYWRVQRSVPRYWKVFTHVEGRIRQNRDHHPVFGFLRFSEIPPGTLIRDSIVVSGDRSGGGEVRLYVGLFDERRVERRMPLQNPAEVRNDGRSRVMAGVLRLPAAP